MTTPNVSGVIPTKFKPWVALLGSLLSFIVPWLAAQAASWPEPWPAVVALAISGLTWLGVYKAPYAPKGTEPVLVPEQRTTPVVIPASAPKPAPPGGPYPQNPWQ